MNPLMKTVRTQAEKDELLRLARAEWDAIPGEFKHLVASSDEEYIAKVADSIIVEKTPFTPARELTAAELAKQNGKLLFEQMYGPRIDHGTGIAALDELSKANQDAELRKLLGPADRAETWLEEMVRKAINKAQSAPRRSVLSLEERMLSWSQGDSDAVRFLRARVAGDLATQRQIARSLAAA